MPMAQLTILPVLLSKLSGIDEKTMMLDTIKLLARGTALPLCIDSTDSEVIEAVLRLYPGRAHKLSVCRNYIERYGEKN